MWTWAKAIVINDEKKFIEGKVLKVDKTIMKWNIIVFYICKYTTGLMHYYNSHIIVYFSP